MNKRTKEEFKPRHNYIVTTATRRGVGEVYDENSNITDEQTVLAVGQHVIDLEPGDIVRFERTAFPSNEVTKDPDMNDKIYTLSADTQKRIDALAKSKGTKLDKELKTDEIKMEFQKQVEALRETTKVYTIPVFTDDFGEEFIWMSDRAIMFKFSN